MESLEPTTGVPTFPLLAAFLHAERFEHLSGALEAQHWTLLPDRHGREKNRYDAVLPKGNTKLGVSGQLKRESPVAALIEELAWR